jgi:tRNA pseudouridine55 synthase
VIPEAGLYLIDKPTGPSSFGVLRSLRPALGRKLGHAGTLDPFAGGLLLVLAGRATRLATFLSGLDKTYRAVVQFGATSTTLDPEGVLAPTGRTTDREHVLAAASGLTGSLLQRVPAASAVKVDGVRAYARMRRGQIVEPSPRTVQIDRLEVEDFDPVTERATVAVACSKGTYVRQIAADLGDATGAGAYCVELLRTSVGPFSIDDAGSPEEVAAAPIGRWHRSPAEALPHLPARQLTELESERIAYGRPLELSGESGATRLLSGGELIAVAEPRDGVLRPVVVFAP